MSESLGVGDRVEIFLDGERWGPEGWYPGTIVRIDPYSEHRSFHWVEMDPEAAVTLGKGVLLISVLNPKNIRRLG
jgi:hypothetical protein